MSDQDDIRDLCFQYTYHLDDGEFDDVASLLAHAVLTPTMAGVEPVEIRGEEAIAAFYRDQVVTYSRGRPMTRHLITNQIIRVDETATRARSKAYFTVLQRVPGQEYHVVVGGRYHDEFEKVDGRWRFVAKNIETEHFNDIHNHFHIAEHRRAQ